MPKEEKSQDDQSQIQNQDSDQETETEETEDSNDDSGSDDSSSSKARDDELASELKGLKAQFARMKERNDYLEQSFALQEKHRQQREAPKDGEEQLSKDLQELDATLDPLFQRRLKKVVDPLLRNVAESTEKMDAIDFKFYLQSEHPEVLENEEDLNSTYQEVEEVRRNAANRGSWISREEAFTFVEGLKFRKDKAAKKKERKTKSVENERKRKTDAKLANIDSDNETRGRDSEAGIKAILEKARRGELLTEDERKKRYEHLKDVPI